MIINRIEDLWKKLKPWNDKTPIEPYQECKITCPKCGMEWGGTMLYCCPDNKCPIQPKVTF